MPPYLVRPELRWNGEATTLSAKRKKRQHPVDFPYGAAHASEVQYLFDLGKVAYPGTLTAAQRQLAGTMKQDWTDLAKSGVPSAWWPRSPPRASKLCPWYRPTRKWRRITQPSTTARSGPRPAERTAGPSRAEPSAAC